MELERKLDTAVEKIDRIEAEADKAKADAASAKAEAAKAKQEAATAKRELAQVKASTGPGKLPERGLAQQKRSKPGFNASAGLVYLRPTRDNLDFVIVDPYNSSEQVRGDYQSVEPGYEPGIRLGFGYDFGTGVDIAAEYTHFRSDESASEVRQTGTLWGTWIHPNAVLDDNDVTSAVANYSARYDVFDLVAGKRFGDEDEFNLRLDAGLRYARIDQNFDIKYRQDIDPVNNRRVNIDSSNNFSGWGPTVGVGFDWPAGNGFTLFGALSGSVLVGDFDLSMYEHDYQVAAVNGTVRVDTEETYNNRMVPVVEMRAGVGYSRKLRNGFLVGGEFGYEWQNWFNMATVRQYTDDVDSQLANTDTTDLSFDGFFLKGFVDF